MEAATATRERLLVAESTTIATTGSPTTLMPITAQDERPDDAVAAATTTIRPRKTHLPEEVVADTTL